MALRSTIGEATQGWSVTGSRRAGAAALNARGSRSGASFVLFGTMVAAIGVGLLPHLAKHPMSLMAAVAVVTLVAGVAALAAGGRGMLRGRRILAKIVGSGAIVVLLLVVVAVVSPGVAATNVPATRVDATPAELGLEFETVTLTTSDGVELVAWYVRGAGRAAVVVRHGAGSTRSDVLEQSAALVRGGFAVLLVDARGHGDSGGTAMDFGWHGDADIAAGTAFLASRPEVDSDRIGVVGFSMGGEEAIGAAATDPLIRAVIAEGATGRQAADHRWLSDVYGWRGWLQERLDGMQDSVTRFLTDAPTPISLRAAVERASDTRFLLITGGDVDDEGHAADHIRAGAPERVVVWTVDGAGHTDGYEEQPDEWQRRTVEFLDTALN